MRRRTLGKGAQVWQGARVVLANLLLTGALAAVGVVGAEGVAALWRGGEPGTGLVHRAWLRLSGKKGDARAVRGAAGKKETDPAKFLKSQSFLSNRCITGVEVIEQILPMAAKAGMIFGNTPFESLVNEKSRMTRDDPNLGLCMKPEMEWRTGFLRSMVFNPYDPPTYSIPAESRTRMPPELAEFIGRYGFAETVVRTDANGDRITVPEEEHPDIVAVVGDSVAFGVMLPEDKTLAAWLQKNHGGARYLNVGVPGSTAEWNLLRLRDRIAKYGGRVRGVIYVLCENDLKDGRGGDVVERLAEELDGADIRYRVFVYPQYIYRLIPEILRSDRNKAAHEADRDRLCAAAEAAGFTVVRGADIVRDYQESAGSLFAAFGLYVDHCHWSAAGVAEVGRRIPPYRAGTAR